MLSPTYRLHFLPPPPDRQLRPSTPWSAREQMEPVQATSELPRPRRRSLADKCKACQRCQQSLRHIVCAPPKLHKTATAPCTKAATSTRPRTSSRALKIAGCRDVQFLFVPPTCAESPARSAAVLPADLRFLAAPTFGPFDVCEDLGVPKRSLSERLMVVFPKVRRGPTGREKEGQRNKGFEIGTDQQVF